MHVRPMLAADVPAAAGVAARAFGMTFADDAAGTRWRGRVAYLLGPDPEGCFVAEARGEIFGVAQAMQRDALWVLSLLAVDPASQSTGAGRALLAAALDYGDPTRGLIVSSDDPRALRVYAEAGFALRPSLTAYGPVRRAPAPEPDPWVRAGDRSDLDLVAELTRAARGGSHAAEVAFALERGAQLLLYEERGCLVTEAGYGVWMLAAGDETAATALLARALALAGDAEEPVRWITAGHDWAIRTVLAAGCRISAYGALCVRGLPGPLAPYLPSAPFA